LSLKPNQEVVRMRNRPTLCGLALWTLTILVPWALTADAVAGEQLVQTVPNLGIPATALGLMLLTAASKDKK
jgi:hypothetical protein